MTSSDQNVTNSLDCPKCGLPREQWSDDQSAAGYTKDHIVYCCRGCAEGPGCTCVRYVAAGERAPTPDEIRDDPESAAFVRSLRHETRHITDADYGTDVTKGRPPGTSPSND